MSDTEIVSLDELAHRDDGHEFLRLGRRKDFFPKAPKSRSGDYSDARELAEWTRPSVEVPDP